MDRTNKQTLRTDTDTLLRRYLDTLFGSQSSLYRSSLRLSPQRPLKVAGTDLCVSVLYAWTRLEWRGPDQTSRGPSTTRSTLQYSRTACLSSGSGCVQQQLLGYGSTPGSTRHSKSSHSIKRVLRSICMPFLWKGWVRLYERLLCR